VVDLSVPLPPVLDRHTRMRHFRHPPAAYALGFSLLFALFIYDVTKFDNTQPANRNRLNFHDVVHPPAHCL
jgi:hypothetical protein